MTENNEVPEAPALTYALWGKGDLTPENAVALLEEYIPDNVGTVFWTGHADRDHKGLRTALDWFESPDFLGEGGAVPSTDVIQSLIDERDGKFHDEVYLLALWPVEPTHEDFDFIERAQREGITVFDLSRALDELDLSLYSRPEPTKEEKADARAEAREVVKRGRRKLSDPAETQEEEFMSPALKAAGAELVTQTEPLDGQGMPELEEVVPDAVVPTTNAISDAQVTYTTAAMELMAAIDSYFDAKLAVEVERKVAEALAKQSGTETIAVLDTTERPPFERPYVGEDTKPYYWSKSTGTYRPAVGKPRRGEELRNMTEQEAAEKGAL